MAHTIRHRDHRTEDVTRTRQPRPAFRRTGTRHGAVHAAMKEAV